MVDIAEKIEFKFVEDDPDYYLVGDEIAHSRLFSTHTAAAAIRGAESSDDHPYWVLDLTELQDLPEAAALSKHGWQRAIFVGKLMTTSIESEQAEIEDNKNNDQKSLSEEGVYKLRRKKVGFSADLFVVQSILQQRDGGFKLAHLPKQDIPQLVASVRNDGKKSLRVISSDLKEHFYDEQYGERPRNKDLTPDLKAISKKGWAAIETFHRSLYDELSEAMASEKPG